MRQPYKLPMFLILACLARAQGGAAHDSSHLSTTIEFLKARSAVWEARMPKYFAWSEWSEAPNGSVGWEGVAADGKLRAEFVRYPLGVSHDSAKGGALGQRAWVTYSGESWMYVEHSAEDSRQPWNGKMARHCPTPHWQQTMLSGLRIPLLDQELRRILEKYPALCMHQTEGRTVVDFACNEATAAKLREGNYSHVFGYLGFRITFAAAADWRPVEIDEYHAEVERFREQDFHGVPKSTLLGAPVAVLRRHTWEDWHRVEKIALPSRCSQRWYISAQMDGSFHPTAVEFRKTLNVRPLDVPPEGVSFALVPPEAAGPTGRLTDLETKQVRVVDGRGVQQREESRDSFVRAVLDVAAGDRSLISWRTCVGWACMVTGLFSAVWLWRNGTAKEQKSCG